MNLLCSLSCASTFTPFVFTVTDAIVQSFNGRLRSNMLVMYQTTRHKQDAGRASHPVVQTKAENLPRGVSFRTLRNSP
eukprot:scaffold423623_cov33-Prasinocladus_malaysianus.AAC.1